MKAVVGGGSCRSKGRRDNNRIPNDGTGNASEICRWSPRPVKYL